MTENHQKDGALERIKYHTQEQLALFAALVLLFGWLGGRIDSGQYGIMFWVGAIGAGITFGIIVRSRWSVWKLIKQLEAHPND